MHENRFMKTSKQYDTVQHSWISYPNKSNNVKDPVLKANKMHKHFMKKDKHIVTQYEILDKIYNLYNNEAKTNHVNDC